MPGRYITIMIFTLIFCTGLCLEYAPFMKAETEPVISSADVRKAQNDMLTDFKHYYSFINDVYYQHNYLLLSHGQSREEAIKYLSFAFKEDLAAAIVDEYTWFIPDLNCLAVKPLDGLPILNQEDLPYLKYQKDKDCLLFSREFNDCYFPGDSFCYEVELELLENRWKISALRLNELPRK